MKRRLFVITVIVGVILSWLFQSYIIALDSFPCHNDNAKLIYITAVKYFESSSENITGVFTGSLESSSENDDLPPLGEYLRKAFDDYSGSYYVMTENSQVLQAYWSKDSSGFSKERDEITKALKNGSPLQSLCIRNEPVGGYPEYILEYRSRAGVIRDAVIDFAIYYFPLVTLLAVYFVITLIITVISKITEKRRKNADHGMQK